MLTQVESNTQTQPNQAAGADPIEQARELLRRYSNGEALTNRGQERDTTALLAAAQIAIAHHLARVADAIEQRNQHLPF